MEQMAQGETKEPPFQRKVKLTNNTELKNWAEGGPRSVAGGSALSERAGAQAAGVSLGHLTSQSSWQAV